MPAYPVSARVTVPAAGHRDPSEAWIPGADTTLYEGPADVQDGGLTTRRGDDAVARMGNRATVFLPTRDASVPIGVAHRGGDDGPIATLVYPDARGTRTGRVIQVDEDDGAFEVEWLS